MYLSSDAHLVNILPPVSISGGKTCQAFSMKNAGHVSILITFGAQGVAVPTSIVLNQCSNVSGSGAAAMGFKYSYQALGGAGNDVLTGPTFVTATGITTFPTTVANLVYVIELDAAELEDLGLPYLQVVIADSGNATIASATAILSQLRVAPGPSQTV